MIRLLFRGGWIFRLHLIILLPALFVFAYLFVDLALHPSISTATSPFEYVSQLLAGLVIAPLTVGAGLYCLRRAPGNVVGPILALWGCGIVDIVNDHTSVWPGLYGYDALYAGIIWPACFYLFSFFPDGRVYPRRAENWIGLCALLTYLGAVLSGLGSAIVPTSASGTEPNPVFIPALESIAPIASAVNIAGAAFAILYGSISLPLRFRASGVRVRQQTKWMLWGFGVFVVLVVPQIASLLLPSLKAYSDMLGGLLALWLMVFPVIAIGNAMLRHNLYDIDTIIRRTLLYGALSIMLALVYWGGVVSLQVLLRTITGQGNDLAIVATTLLVAALFLPLRRAVQGFIDRRFYRRKYDAARTLAAFGQVARDEVDLQTLTGRLVDVVGDTMQPEHISLWLLPAGGPHGYAPVTQEAE